MLWLVALAASVASPHAPAANAPAVVQANATVRIVSGVRLQFQSLTNDGAPPAHRTIVTTDGAPHPAQLIEFE